MRHSQLVCHQLVHVFPVGQTDILMKHQAMNDSQDTINTINGQQDYPTEIFCFNDKSPYQKKENKSDTHRTDITRKTLRLLTEIEETKDQDGTKNGIDQSGSTNIVISELIYANAPRITNE